MAKRQNETIKSVSRGLEAITLSGGNRTRAAAAAARENSTTRAMRSWVAVGDSLRVQMRNTSTNRSTNRSTPR